MTLAVSQWPFLPEEQHILEQNELWWAECYVPSPADVTLRGIAHSVIVSGEPGSGKSIALKAFEKMEAERLFMVRYPVARWPGELHAWVRGHNHLGQIMACASMAIKEFLTRQAGKLDQLSKINLEYLRWLIEKYNGERAFRRWADATGNQAVLDLLDYPFDDLYPTDTELLDVQGQIEELVILSRRLGFEGVAVIIDVNDAEITDAIIEKMKDLFGWLTPLQSEGFALKTALPENTIERAQLIHRSRGRISFTSLRWSIEECRELGNRCLRAATNHQLKSLAEIASAPLLARLEKEIQALYDAPLPQAWLWLSATLLNEYAKRTRKLTKGNYNNLIHTYFYNYVPLKFDKEHRSVRRGAQLIALDDQPFNFLEILWLYRNTSGYANEALIKMAYTQGNLNTIASRLRQKIEPVPGKSVYIHNSRSQGYWLENVVEAQPDSLV